MLGVGVSAWLVAEAAPLPSMQRLFCGWGSVRCSCSPGLGREAWGYPGISLLASSGLWSKTEPLQQDPTSFHQLSTFREGAGRV